MIIGPLRFEFLSEARQPPVPSPHVGLRDSGYDSSFTINQFL